MLKNSSILYLNLDVKTGSDHILETGYFENRMRIRPYLEIQSQMKRLLVSVCLFEKS